MGPTQRRSELAELAQGALPIMTRYEPVRLLGRGGMGAVYEVVDRRSGRRVALKKILTPDPRQQLRFKREFRLMADLRHPNLVQLFDLGLEDDTWFFTMELIEGASWLDACGRRRDAAADRLAESTRDLEARGVSQSWDTPPSDRDASATIAAPASAASLEDVRELLAQLLAALAFLHQQGIVHRDLKPSNVLVDRDGQVKVLDFGLASQLERDQEFTQALSRTGVALGTVAYMAPEQLQGQPVTAKADLYSLGCMLFQALTGRLPHTGSPAKILEARLHEPAPRVERYVDDVPEELCAVCRALLDRDPERRPTIDALRDALGLPHSTPDPTSGQTASPFASD
ncbi:MAG: serine/threonine protein kinase, partial [Myxococcales bacterium]|nr:serine/threonine protein kinase [Myxococcales bacterium]